MENSRFITKSISFALVALLVLSLSMPTWAANICDATTGSQCQKVQPTGAAEEVTGRSSRATYVASVAGQATTAAITLSVESASGTGFRLLGWCVSGVSNATAAAAVTVTVQRRTTPSTGGTALTAEGTGTTSISKMDPADGNYGGIARLGGTTGTAGAVLDQAGFQVGEIGAGSADPNAAAPYCKYYGLAGEKAPIVAAGVTNGLSVSVSSAGAGGLAAGSISAIISAE